MYSSTNKTGDMINGFSLCELRHLGGCRGRLHRHHIISRGKLRNVAGGLAYCEKWREVLIADICEAHHIGGVADTKENRALLLQARVDLWGQDYVSGVLDGLCALCKVPPEEWQLSALLIVSGKEIAHVDCPKD